MKRITAGLYFVGLNRFESDTSMLLYLWPSFPIDMEQGSKTTARIVWILQTDIYMFMDTI